MPEPPTTEDVIRIAEEVLAQHVLDRHTRKKTSGVSPEGFEAFWAVWTHRVGRDSAEKAWANIHPGPLLADTIVTAAQAQIKAFGNDWARDNHKFMPHASTWLNQKRWKDEIESGKKPAPQLRPREKSTLAGPILTLDERIAMRKRLERARTPREATRMVDALTAPQEPSQGPQAFDPANDPELQGDI